MKNQAPSSAVHVVLLTATLVVGAPGCVGKNARDATDEGFRRLIDERYVAPYKNGQLDRWLDIFADDAVALHDGLPPLEGKSAIREFGEAVSANFVIEKMDVTVQKIQHSKDVAWTWGTFSASFAARSDQAPPGVAGPRTGKFLFIWRWEADGRWRIVLDMGNRTSSP